MNFSRNLNWISSKSFVRSLSQKSLVLPTIEADLINGIPPQHSSRKVYIYKPANTTMQSGVGNSQFWKIDFDTQKKWENPLMGWASSGDPLQATCVKFKTKEDAIQFSERQGYSWTVIEPKEAKFRVKSYAANFKYVPGKIRKFFTK